MFRYSIALLCLLTVALTGSGEGNRPDASEDPVHLLFTTNLSGSLDDCRCGGPVVGGMNRLLHLIERQRERHPDLLLVDGGDFLNSYSLPDANRIMLRLMAMARYDAVAVGDQEFVETPDFLREALFTEAPPAPLLAANLRHPAFPDFDGVRRTRAGATAVAIAALVGDDCFDFIDPGALERGDPAAALRAIAAEMQAGSDLQVLLWHGGWTEARAVATAFPWLDVMILGHNHLRHVERIGTTTLAEAGSAAEYLGHLVLHDDGGAWRADTLFHPVTAGVPVDGDAEPLVRGYFDGLRSGGDR